MWSPWVCDRSKCARIAPFVARERPSFRAPVPQSKMRSAPSSVTVSMHGVLPPKRIVSGPAAAMEPLVPQKRMRMSATCRREHGELRGEVAQHFRGGVVRAQRDERPAAVRGLVEDQGEGDHEVRLAIEEAR